MENGRISVEILILVSIISKSSKSRNLRLPTGVEENDALSPSIERNDSSDGMMSKDRRPKGMGSKFCASKSEKPDSLGGVAPLS